MNSFSPQVGGFDIFSGDLDVFQSTGNIFLVSSTQNIIWEMTSAGVLVQAFDVTSLGITGMSGIDFDDATGNAWISSVDGTVYQVGGIAFSPEVIPEPSTFLLFLVGILGVSGLGYFRRKKTA